MLFFVLGFVAGVIAGVFLCGLGKAAARGSDDGDVLWLKRLDLIRDAAVGMETEIVASNDMRWSPSYETVVDLRQKYDASIRQIWDIQARETGRLRPGNQTVGSPPPPATAP